MVRDGAPDRGRVARPVDRGAGAPERGLGGRGRSRRRGDPRGGGVLPARRVAHERLRRRAHQERPGRVPRAAPGADAAQVVPGRRSRCARARVYASGLAYDALSINGSHGLATRVLDPGFTDYSRTVLYTTHDVTALVRQGENVIASELGSGHFDDATRTWDWGWEKAQWRGDAAAAARPAHHLRRRVRSRWSRRTTPGRSASAARRATTATTSARPTTRGARSRVGARPASTTRAGRPPGSWTAPAGVLRAQVHEPIRVVSSRPPGTRDGARAGRLRLRHRPEPHRLGGDPRERAGGHRGRDLLLREARRRTARPAPLGNDLVFGQLQTDYYVAKGAGDERFTPRFSYKGFQYVQLSGPRGEPLPAGASVSGRADPAGAHGPRGNRRASTRAARRSNRIHRNTAWAVQSNLHGDHHRHAGLREERLDRRRGSSPPARPRCSSTPSGSTGSCSRTCATRRRAEGELPLLCPSNRNYGYVGKPAFKPEDCCGATPAWDAFWFVIPWESYRRYGDRARARARPTRRCRSTSTCGSRAGPARTATPTRRR